MQPILAREVAGGYEIIAGERRWRAAQRAPVSDIPAVVREVTDAEALLLNALENKDREDLSAAEEAVLVRRMVGALHGDRDEAARRLGFSRKVLDARLLLLNATDAVREALAARKIKIGHAELLATLPADKQGKGLESVMAKSMSIEELRRNVDLYALNLKAAIFDTTGCRECHHNTSLQASLFEQHIGDGRCTNRVCFEDKRFTVLLARKAELLETYPVLFSDQDKDPASYTLLVKHGGHGVGSDQYSACLSCANYGALMSTAAGQEGQVTKDVCFDTSCHRTKVAAYQASLRPSDPVTPEETQAEPATSVSKGSAKKSTTKSSAAAKAVPKRIEDLIHRFWRDTAATAVLDDAQVVLAYAVYALTQLAGSEGRDKALRAAGFKTADFRLDLGAKAIEMLLKADKEKLLALQTALAVGFVRDKLENGHGKSTPMLVDVAKRTLKHCGTALDQHFVLNEEFLSSHTKSGIESLMGEAGFDTWYNTEQKSDKAFTKLLAEKHGTIVKAILASKFDFAGFVPKAAKV